MKRVGSIYRFIGPTGKSYIGQTTNLPDVRKAQHRKSAEKGVKTKFYDAIRKYGFDSFDFEVVYTLVTEGDLRQELNALETYYIGKYDSYQNGYNMTIGGDTCGKTVGKQISSYDKEGNYVATFESAEDAARILGRPKSSSTIRECARKEYGTALGFQWRDGDIVDNIGPVVYEERTYPVLKGKDNHRSKKVYQYSKSGELVKIWNAALEAEREEGFSSTEISNAANGKKEHYGKKGQQRYIWSFDPLTKEDVLDRVQNMKSKYKYTHEN